MNDRKTPDIQFVESDPEQIITTMVETYEAMTGRTLYPASPERLFIAWLASIIVQQRALINQTAKQNIPRFADGEYLDELAGLFKDVERLPAESAKATFRCYISEEQDSSVFIPQGTRITVSGELMFATDELVEIPAGDLYADVTGTCMTPGTEGNGYTAGQIKEIVDVYDYYQKIENITTSSGGTEIEDDDSFYNRMRESMESFSTAGPAGAYKYFAESASNAVQDVVATSPDAGEVDVRILPKDRSGDASELIAIVEAALNDEKVRPLTDSVTVQLPDDVTFNVSVKYYISRDDSASATIIADAAAQAVDDYIEWQIEKMGRDINPSKLHAMLMNAGVKRVEITYPEFTEVDETEVAKLGTKTVVNGGLEDV